MSDLTEDVFFWKGRMWYSLESDDSPESWIATPDTKDRVAIR